MQNQNTNSAGAFCELQVSDKRGTFSKFQQIRDDFILSVDCLLAIAIFAGFYMLFRGASKLVLISVLIEIVLVALTGFLHSLSKASTVTKYFGNATFDFNAGTVSFSGFDNFSLKFEICDLLRSPYYISVNNRKLTVVSRAVYTNRNGAYETLSISLQADFAYPYDALIIQKLLNAGFKIKMSSEVKHELKRLPDTLKKCRSSVDVDVISTDSQTPMYEQELGGK